MEIKRVPISWQNERRKLSALKEWSRNPRQAKEKQKEDLEDSIEKFNLADPLVINKDNVIIGGHFRCRILKERRIEEVDVRVPDRQLTEEEVEELNLRLNKNLGEWDLDLLADFNEEILLDVGFERGELDSIFAIDIDEEFDVEKELEKFLRNGVRRVKDGDIWQLGDHKLIIGDCIKKEIWENLFGEERFDFMFTDPPYKLAYTQRLRKIKTKKGAKLKKDKIYLGTGKTNNKGKPKGFGYKSQRSYLGVEKKGGVPEYDEWLSMANEHQKLKGANILIFENWRNTAQLWMAIEKYWKIKNMIIWHLPNRCQGFSANYLFFNKYDIAPLASKGNAVLNEEYEREFDEYLKEKGQKLLDSYEVILYGKQGKGYWDKKKGTNWARINDHITWAAETGKSSGQGIIFGTKPIQILVPYIKILSPRYGIVGDPFGGSGSTMIACEIMKRRCRTIEIEPIYGEVILLRWERLTGRKAEKYDSRKDN